MSMIIKNCIQKIDTWENSLNINAFKRYLQDERKKFENLSSGYTQMLSILQKLASNDLVIPEAALFDIQLTASKSLRMSKLLIQINGKCNDILNQQKTGVLTRDKQISFFELEAKRVK